MTGSHEPHRAVARVSATVDGTVVVELVGGIDMGARTTVTGAIDGIACEVRSVVVDLAGVDFVALAGLDTLQRLALEARDRGIGLRFDRCPRAVRRTLELAARIGATFDLPGIGSTDD